MDEVVHQLESQIDRSRERLGSHLRELEARVDAATDWRSYVRARPYAAVATALAAGAALSVALGSLRRPSRVSVGAAPTRPFETAPRGQPSEFKRQITDLWHDISAALLGVAAGRLTGAIGDLVPGFVEELDRSSPRRYGSRAGADDTRVGRAYPA
jgi:hypothetical protein